MDVLQQTAPEERTSADSQLHYYHYAAVLAIIIALVGGLG
jgi:hypothetical protein